MENRIIKVLRVFIGTTIWMLVYSFWLFKTVRVPKSDSHSVFFNARSVGWPWWNDVPGYLFRCTEDSLLLSVMAEGVDNGISMDYGMADGASLATLFEGRRLTFGFDINYEKFGALARSVVEQLVGGSAYALPFRAESMDVIIAERVFLHLNMESAIPEIARVLKPGGACVATTISDNISIFNPTHRKLMARVFGPGGHGRAIHHVTFHDHKWYEEQFGVHGLRLVDFRYGLTGSTARIHNLLKALQVLWGIQCYGKLFVKCLPTVQKVLASEWGTVPVEQGMILAMRFEKL